MSMIATSYDKILKQQNYLLNNKALHLHYLPITVSFKSDIVIRCQIRFKIQSVLAYSKCIWLMSSLTPD